MKRIYSVNINGKTLESWDLRRLLARAVSAKRKSDYKSRIRAGSCEPLAADKGPEPCMAVGSTVVQ